MSERTFHPLCEQLADVLSAGLKAALSGEEIAQDILDAINGSGVAWVAPYVATDTIMLGLCAESRGWDESWAHARDAYLAKQKD